MPTRILATLSSKDVSTSKHTTVAEHWPHKEWVKMRVVQQDRGNTARLETYAAVSECSQQTPAESQPHASPQVLRNDQEVASLGRIAYEIRSMALADGQDTVRLTSRLRASSRALHFACLIGRGAVPCPL
jgi:hypothetical protein